MADKHASTDFRQRRALQRLANGTDSLERGARFEDFELGVERPAGYNWDGKPVYRMILAFGALPNATTKSMLHGITGVTAFVKLYGWAVRPGDAMHVPIPNGC